ncbi:MAG: MerR family transcriptional regulator [Flavisolibacter sp.]
MAFTIRELESLSGIKAHTIRIWEQRYHFLKPSRTSTNIRTYSNEELKTLLNVSLLNKFGYKISRIDQMLPEQRVDTILQLTQEEAYSEHIVNEMIAYMINLENLAFEQLLNYHISQHGIEKTITGIIFQFLERIGILWQANRILPAQEHIVSNIIRQKIVSAIENLPFVQKPDPLCLLFLPEDEHHEMGLLFVYYLLRKKNISVIYLGSNVPLKDVQYLMEVKSPQYLYLHLTSFPRQQQFQKFITTLSGYAGKSKILISGGMIQTYKSPQPENVSYLPSFTAVSEYIESMN